MAASQMRSNWRTFLGFVLLSGLGWLCDMLSFTALVRLAGMSPFGANVISSYVGVTFVWFTAVGTLFRHDGNGSAGGARHGGRYLLIYWCYQFLSIMAYSQLLHLAATTLAAGAGSVAGHSAIIAKLLVTPVNLVTNFLFMKVLTRAIRAS